MNGKISIFAAVFIIGLLGWIYISGTQVPGGRTVQGGDSILKKSGLETNSDAAKEITERAPSSISWGMKWIDDSITDDELDKLSSMGITVLSGEWGMDSYTPKEMLAFLDRIEARGMKYVVNFSEESAWGYETGGSNPESRKPVWQEGKVFEYISAISRHPAIYGYDVSNEAGENLPNGDSFRITAEQMRRAAETIRRADAGRPVLIRMHYWDEYDGDFGPQNPFGRGIADIVMLNLYSNFTTGDGESLLPNMVSDSGSVLAEKIRNVDPDAEVWLAVAVFEDDGFLKPAQSGVKKDIKAGLDAGEFNNISFFGWGNPDGWYLPRDGKDLLDTILSFTGA